MGTSEIDPITCEPRPWNAGRKIGAKRALKPRQVTPTSTITSAWNVTSSTAKPTVNGAPPRWRSGRCLRARPLPSKTD